MRRARTYRPNYRVRRLIVAIITGVMATMGAAAVKWQEPTAPATHHETTAPTARPVPAAQQARQETMLASQALAQLEVKGRAPKTGYTRAQFGVGWQRIGEMCDTRNLILKRDLQEVQIDERCKVRRGVLQDPYTGATVHFIRGANSSDKVQIDHVVALSNAWQTGAQQLAPERRVAFANDPLNLLAVDGAANQQKGDADAATWLPPHKPYRCAYVARQIAIKQKYALWVVSAEKEAMQRVLAQCPNQTLPMP